MNTDFIKLIIAHLSGDEAGATAIRIYKKAKASYSSQISIKQNNILNIEVDIESAEDELSLVRINNGEIFTDSVVYINKVTQAKEKLAALVKQKEVEEESIKMFQEELALLDKTSSTAKAEVAKAMGLDV